MKKQAALILTLTVACTVAFASCTAKYKKEEATLSKQLDDCKKELSACAAQKAAEEAKIKKDDDTYNQLVAGLKDEIQKDNITVNKYKDAVTINIADHVLFDLGKYNIKKEYYPILNKIGAILRSKADKFIQIEGHTDNVPIAEDYKKFIPDNWALGARRAISVTNFFIDNFNIDPHRIAVTSFSKYRPLLPNTTAKNRAKNRRIEIVLLNKLLFRDIEAKQNP